MARLTPLHIAEDRQTWLTGNIQIASRSCLNPLHIAEDRQICRSQTPLSSAVCKAHFQRGSQNDSVE